jgi:hypothetical protein
MTNLLVFLYDGALDLTQTSVGSCPGIKLCQELPSTPTDFGKRS